MWSEKRKRFEGGWEWDDILIGVGNKWKAKVVFRQNRHINYLTIRKIRIVGAVVGVVICNLPSGVVVLGKNIPIMIILENM